MASPNRKTRRAAKSDARKTKPSNGANGAESVTITIKWRGKITRANNEVIAIERRLAQLLSEQQALLGLRAQKQQELGKICENAMRAAGVDFEDGPGWRLNPDTFEVVQQELPPQPPAAPEQPAPAAS